MTRSVTHRRAERSLYPLAYQFGSCILQLVYVSCLFSVRGPFTDRLTFCCGGLFIDPNIKKTSQFKKDTAGYIIQIDSTGIKIVITIVFSGSRGNEILAICQRIRQRRYIYRVAIKSKPLYHIINKSY